MDKYLFPAVFEPGENKGYCVTFPDLPGCITEGDTLEEALRMAKEALELHIYGMEEDGDDIPQPTPPEKIQDPGDGFVTVIEAWMDLVRDEMANKAVKKTLTIPKWLNDLAEKSQINFSHILQVALKTRLGIVEPNDKITRVPRTGYRYKVVSAKALAGSVLSQTSKAMMVSNHASKVAKKTSSGKAPAAVGKKK